MQFPTREEGIIEVISVLMKGKQVFFIRLKK